MITQAAAKYYFFLIHSWELIIFDVDAELKKKKIWFKCSLLILTTFLFNTFAEFYTFLSNKLILMIDKTNVLLDSCFSLLISADFCLVFSIIFYFLVRCSLFRINYLKAQLAFQKALGFSDFL